MSRLFVIALLFPLFAVAQGKPAERSCRVLFLNPPADAPRKLFLFDGVKSQEIDLPEMNFSDVYQVAGGETTIRLLTHPVIKADDVPAGAPAGTLAESITEFYMIVSANSTNLITPVQLQIIDSGSEKFKKGQMMWYNLTNFAVGGQLGSQTLSIKGQSRVITDAPTNAAVPFPVKLSYLILDDPQLHPICQTQWMHDPRSRMVMFIYGGQNNTAPEISGFKDFREKVLKSD